MEVQRSGGCSYCFKTGYRVCESWFKGNEPIPNVQVDQLKVEGIHTAVNKAVNEDTLNMTNWHSKCGTTHCRSGWAITLAGVEAKRLEALTNSMFAGMVVFALSSDITLNPQRFYDSKQNALQHIEACADQEQKEGK